MEVGKMTFESIPMSLRNILEEAIETFVIKSDEKKYTDTKKLRNRFSFPF